MNVMLNNYVNYNNDLLKLIDYDGENLHNGNNLTGHMPYNSTIKHYSELKIKPAKYILDLLRHSLQTEKTQIMHKSRLKKWK